MGWTPDAFWRSTPHEFWGAYEVWREMNVPESDDD